MFITVTNLQELIDTIETSSGYIFIYKHSTTCPTAILAKQQIEKALESYPETLIIYVHVRDQRELSNEIAQHFNIQHESPQLISIKDKKIKDTKNHHSISTAYLSHTLGGGYNG